MEPRMERIKPEDLRHAQKSTTESTERNIHNSQALLTPEASQEARQKRYQVITEIIDKSRAACNLDPLYDEAMAVTYAAWSEVLADVPIRYLNECYLLAIKAHKSSFPLGVGEITAQWTANCETWTTKESTPE